MANNHTCRETGTKKVPSAVPRKHVSIISSSSMIALEVCQEKGCCEGRVHCPLCQGVILPLDQAQSHVDNAHLDDAIHTTDGVIILQCKLKCGLYYKVPHYHCARCPLLFRAKEHLTNHMVKICGKRNKINLKKPSTSTSDVGPASSTSALDHLTSAELSKLPFWHISFMGGPYEVKVERCQTCCNSFHCPLCPDEVFKPTTSRRVSDHLLQVHMRHDIQFSDVKILKCRLDCMETRRTIGESHFHCPLCPQKMLFPERLVHHLNCHAKGTTKPRKRLGQNSTDTSATQIYDADTSAASTSLAIDQPKPTVSCPSTAKEKVAFESDTSKGGSRSDIDNLATVSNSPTESTQSPERSRKGLLVHSKDDAKVFEQVSVSFPLERFRIITVHTYMQQFTRDIADTFNVHCAVNEKKLALTGTWDTVSLSRQCINDILDPSVTSIADVKSIMRRYASTSRLKKEPADVDIATQPEQNIRQSVNRKRGRPRKKTTDLKSGTKVLYSAESKPYIIDFKDSDDNNPDKYLTSLPMGRCNKYSSYDSSTETDDSLPQMKKAKVPNDIILQLSNTDDSGNTKSEPIDDKKDDTKKDIRAAGSMEETETSTHLEIVVEHGYSLETPSIRAMPDRGGSSVSNKCEETDMELSMEQETDKSHHSSTDAVVEDDSKPVEIQIEIPENTEPEKCPVCDEECESRAHLLLHLSTSNCQETSKSRLLHLPKDLRNQYNRMKKCVRTTCYMCKKKFSHVLEAKLHYAMMMCKTKVHKKNPHNIPRRKDTGLYYCTVCGYEGSIPHKVVVHMQRKHMDKDVPCDVCGKLFSTQQFADIHKNLVHGDKRTKNCPICGQAYYAKYLNRHIKDTHKKQYIRTSRQKSSVDLKCDLCHYTTRYQGDLDRHQARMHSERIHSCQQCDQKFAIKQDLVNHERKIHAPQRDYACCCHCGKTMLKINLPLHIRNVHEEVKEFVCPTCGKALQSKFSLRYHLETHKKPSERAYRFRCQHCGSGFMNRSVLNDHLNTHSGQRPYKCATCLKAFRQRSVYHKHLEIHSNVKFMCAFCGLVFPSKKAISEHKQEHKRQELSANVIDDGKLIIDSQDGSARRGALSVEQVAAMLAEHGPEMHSREVIQLDDGTMLVVQYSEMNAQLNEEVNSLQDVGGDEAMLGVEEDSISNHIAAYNEVEETLVQQPSDAVELSADQQLLSIGDYEHSDVSTVTDDADILNDGVVADNVIVQAEARQGGNQESYVCGYCNQEFQSLEGIQEHIVARHADQTDKGAPLQLHLQPSGLADTAVHAD